MIVTDYKTGKPALGWKGSDEWEKIKLYKYRQQLMFYQLLIGHSRDYHTYSVLSGRLCFVEPTRAGDISTLELSFEKDELERFSLLIQKIWQKIMTLDLPDISAYEPTLRGIMRFEDDLLNDAL